MARQLKMDKLREKTQLGDFCAQFDLLDPSAKDRNKDRYYKSSRTEGSHKKRRSRQRSKEKHEAKKSFRKSKRFTKDRSGRDLDKIKCYKCVYNVYKMNLPWIHIKGRGRGRSSPGKGPAYGAMASSSQGSSYRSSLNSPLIQISSSQEESSSSSKQLVNLEDILKDSPLYAHMQAYLEAQKQKESFASIAKKDTDDIRSYEKLQKKEMIFLLENSDLQRKDESWKIFQRYLINGLYYSDES
ncbi:hypothetical protein H5410_031257 [Solanum commersonii]|uniref:Uncharacterized protein n=1 Tax=Solanum commersonii TaxID=4109 RepID=A0A9J5YJD4_SOLCO|nr:hypothetical protein H5410_031257 [Solanum commersonii]